MLSKSMHFPFEGVNPNGKFYKICDDMKTSAAWQSLNRSQRCLYHELKSKFIVKKVKGRIIYENSRNISFTTSEAQKLYGELRTFRSDVDKLIECGFIDCIESGYTTRTASIYGFAERWKSYGKPGYEVPYQMMRPKTFRNKKNAK